MNTLKKLASVFMATLLCFTLFSFVGCGGKGETYTAYEFTVQYEDGSAASGVQVQLCAIENGAVTTCYAPVATDEAGKAVYNPQGFPGAGLYEVHVLNYEVVSEDETPTKYSAMTIVIRASAE